MAFGQQSGPPASHRQVQTLLELLADAGHSDFRDARGPMGFTQRQAGGKFTVEEAQAFIDQLEAAAHEAEAPPAPSSRPGAAAPRAAASKPAPRPGAAASKPQRPAGASPARSAGTAPAPRLKVSRTEKLLADLPDDVLAAELQRRGWIVAEP
ncbi:MAG: hypothetical protein ACE367_02910 [Acidimicrobiales bacterium]